MVYASCFSASNYIALQPKGCGAFFMSAVRRQFPPALTFGVVAHPNRNQLLRPH
jgi:hypothetical protein